MPLLDVQRSLRQLGKIRMGEKKRTAAGKEYPSKLAHWRLTSPAFELLEVVAQVYGGEVTRWDGAPTEGEQFQCYTDTDRLRVIVPPGDNALQQWHETWSAGGCSKRCDGEVEQLSNQPCSCPADLEQRSRLAAQGKACKMTTRLKVILPDIPDIGVFMLESHGYYAAVELAGTEELLQMAAARGTMIPAQLRIDQRTAKRNGETRRFAVPVLELLSITPNMLMTGEVSPTLGAGNGNALASPVAAALPAAKVPPRTDRPEGKATSTGPPLPPLPHEVVGEGVLPGVPDEPEGGAPAGRTPAPSPAGAPSPPVNRVAIAAREAGLDDDGRHDLAEWASVGRVRSSALLDEGERGLAIDMARKIQAGHARLQRTEEGGLEVRDPRFGWPAEDPVTGSTNPDTVPDVPPLSADEIVAMKGPALMAALRERGLPLGGKVEEVRARLMEACGVTGDDSF